MSKKTNVATLNLALGRTNDTIVNGAHLRIASTSDDSSRVVCHLVNLPRDKILHLSKHILGLCSDFARTSVGNKQLHFSRNNGRIFSSDFDFALDSNGDVIAGGNGPFEFTLAIVPVGSHPDTSIIDGPFIERKRDIIVSNAQLQLRSPSNQNRVPLVAPGPGFTFVGALAFQIADLPLRNHLMLSNISIALTAIVDRTSLAKNGLICIRGNDRRFDSTFAIRIGSGATKLKTAGFLDTPRMIGVSVTGIGSSPIFLSTASLQITRKRGNAVFNFNCTPKTTRLVCGSPSGGAVRHRCHVAGGITRNELALGNGHLKINDIFARTSLSGNQVRCRRSSSRGFSSAFRFKIQSNNNTIIPKSFGVIISPAIGSTPRMATPARPRHFSALSSFIFDATANGTVAVTSPSLLSISTKRISFVQIALSLQTKNDACTTDALALTDATKLAVVNGGNVPKKLVALTKDLTTIRTTLGKLSIRIPASRSHILRLMVATSSHLSPNGPTLLGGKNHSPIKTTTNCGVIDRAVTVCTDGIGSPPAVAKPTTVTLGRSDSIALNNTGTVTVTSLSSFNTPVAIALSVPKTAKALALPNTANGNAGAIALANAGTSVGTTLRSLACAPLTGFGKDLALATAIGSGNGVNDNNDRATAAAMTLAIGPLGSQPALAMPNLRAVSGTDILALTTKTVTVSSTRSLLCKTTSDFAIAIATQHRSGDAPFKRLDTATTNNTIVKNRSASALAVANAGTSVGTALGALACSPIGSGVSSHVHVAIAISSNGGKTRNANLMNRDAAHDNDFLIGVSKMGSPPVLATPAGTLSIGRSTTLALAKINGVFDFSSPSSFKTAGLATALAIARNALSLISTSNAVIDNDNAGALALANDRLTLGTTLSKLVFAPAPGCRNDTRLAIAVGSRNGINANNTGASDIVIPVAIGPIGSHPITDNSVALARTARSAVPNGFALTTLMTTGGGCDSTASGRATIKKGAATAKLDRMTVINDDGCITKRKD